MKDQLKTLIQEKITRAFMPEYRAQATDPEALGMILSEYFEWDGLAILKTCFAALEDANFHAEAAEIEKMIERVAA